jgi:spermidine synthase
MEGKTVLSTLRSRPGPLHDMYDVFAACAAVLVRGPRIVLLGFAGGGILAPLRAAGCRAPIEAVDRTRRGERVFRRLASDWCGEVRLIRAHADDWLRRSRARYDLIVEDLTVNGADGPTKPEVCVNSLPDLLDRRLAPGGVVVTNVLPVSGWTLRRLLTTMSAPHPQARVIHFLDWENRLLVAGTSLPPARILARRLGAVIDCIGSRMRGRFAVRTFHSS